MHAEMLVDMTYTAPASKDFTVASQSGEKWIIDYMFQTIAGDRTRSGRRRELETYHSR